MVGLALVFCAGIALGEWWTMPLVVLWFSLPVAMAASAILFRRRVGLAAFFIAVLIGGSLAHRLANSHPQPNHLLRLLGDRSQNVVARGTIAVEPVRSMLRSARGPQERDFFSVRVTALDCGDGLRTASGEMVVWLDQPASDHQLRFGDVIEFRGLLQRVPAPVNPGQFDYCAHLARRGVFYEARVRSAGAVTVLGHESPWWMECGMWMQRRFLASAGRGLETSRVGDEPVVVGLLRAMLVGFRPGLTNELAEPFMRTGTLHVFAVSGLHVAVIAGILVGVLRFCRVGRLGCALIALPLLLFYTVATGAPASAVRSFLMAAIVIIGWSLQRPTDLLNSLATSAVLILLWDPMQLFEPGFQLSYAAVLAIALLVPGPGLLVRTLYRRDADDSESATVRARLPGRLADLFVCDPYLPTELLPRWRRAWYAVVRAVTASFAVSAAACIGTMPLIAHYFHLFTAVNFLSNLVIVPLSTFTITTGFASFLLDLVWPPLAAVLNNANYAFMELMLGASRWFEQLPLAFVYVKSPPVWLAAAFYGALGLFLWAAVRKLAQRFAWLGVAALCALAIGLAARNGEETATLTVLSAGDGAATFVDLPGEKHDTLIDCGPPKSANFVLKAFLRAQGCDTIETLILTHPDVAHIGAVGAVLDGFRPKRIFDNGQSRWARVAGGPLPGFRASRLIEPATLTLGGGAELRVLYPRSGPLPALGDNAALVLQLRRGPHRILLASDIGATVERELLAARVDLRSDVLIKGLHSRENSCTDEFLDAVAPQWVVLSCGEAATRASTLPAMLNRIAAHGARVLRTDLHGAVTIRMTPDDLDVKSFLPVPAAVLSSARRETP
jgi:competence protein ComEC